MSAELETVARGMSAAPVRVEDIIRELGIQYRNIPMPAGQSGYIEHENGRYTITVNASESAHRQRFTAAHELAHYLLHRDLLVERGGLARHSDSLFGEFAPSNPPQPFSPTHEVEANKLAAQIIMPRDAVSSAFEPFLDNVDEVAKRFGVSRQAMAIRLKTLNLRNAQP